MGVFLISCLPASWFIDTWGIRKGLGIGAGLTGLFGLVKGVFPHDYTFIVIAQTGLAVAQPFILNAATKVAVQWFPLKERAIAVGIATLAQFVGIIIVMIVTPLMIRTSTDGGYDLSGMLMTYGLVFFSDYGLLLISSFVLGFFLLGAGAPIGFQYCAEITCPAPESLSQGLLLLNGQVSGIMFILLFNLAGVQFSMLVFLALAFINIGLSLALKESTVILAARQAAI